MKQNQEILRTRVGSRNGKKKHQTGGRNFYWVCYHTTILTPCVAYRVGEQRVNVKCLFWHTKKKM